MSQPSNTFGINQQPTFGPVGGGFVFGGPQNDQPPQTGMQDSGNGFTFNAGQQSSNPFANTNFSNNPFGNVNGTPSNSFGNTNGNFGGNNMNPSKRSNDDMMMESPEKKPFAPSFGASQNGSFNQSNGGLFGAVSKPEQPQQNNPFGQTQNSSSFGGFGQPKQNVSAATSLSFGQKEQTPTPPASFGTSFGQTTSEKPKYTFGAPATTQASQASNSPLLFGQNATTQNADIPSFGSNESSRATSPFKFGSGASEATTSAPLFGIQAPTPVKQFGFGQNTNDSLANKPEETKTTSSLFGQSSTSQPSGNLFGQSTASQPPSTLFGSTVPPAAKTSSSFSFGQPAEPQPSVMDPKPTEAPKNPFAAVPHTAPSTSSSSQAAKPPVETSKSPAFSFGAPPTPAVGPLGTSATAPPASANIFGVSKPSQPPSTSLFGSPSKKPESPEKEEEPVPPKPAFNFGGTQPPSSGGLFTPVKPTASNQNPSTEPPKAPSFGSLFQVAPAAAPEPASEKPKKQLFGRKLDGTPAASQPAVPEPAVKAPLFGTNPAAKSSTENAAEKPATSIFAAPAAPAAPKTAAKPFAPAPVQSATAESAPQRPVYTKSPGRIPKYLNGEGYKEFDNNFRLRALNREFQRKVTGLDADRHDFENLIRHYVAARASIGADIGLYQRTMAGTKRKNDTVDEEELEVPQQYKKSKPSQPPPSAAPAQPRPSSMNNKSSANTFAAGLSSAPAVKATSMLNQMIPKSPGKTADPPKPAASDKPPSVFASIPNPAPAPQSFIRNLVNEIETDSAPKAASAPTFGQSQATTTPAKPPASQPSFKPYSPAPMTGMPSAPTSNLFASFANAAADTDKKRKAELLEDDYSSDEDSQAEGLKKIEEESRLKRAKYESIAKTGFTFTPNSQKSTSPTKPSSKMGFTSGTQKSTSPSKSPPKSGFTPLGSGIEKSMSPSAKAKRNSPFESDSDDSRNDEDVQAHADDEETAEERDDDFVPGEDEVSGDDSDEEEEEEDDLPEDDVVEDTEEEVADVEAEIAANPNKGKSLWDRVEPNPEKASDSPVNGDWKTNKFFAKSEDPIMGSAKNSSFKPAVWGAHIGKSTPQAPEFSPITPATSSYKPATTFTFTPTPPTTTPTPVPGASVLSGGLTAGSYTKFDGMFGSRPTTPNPEKESPANTAGPVNHTWTAGSPIKFGETPEKAAAPRIDLTEASPEKDGDTTPTAGTPRPFGSLFGTTPASTFKSGEMNSGFSFGAGKPDFLNAKKSLDAASGLTSGISSRGTSPGLTDAESVQTDASDAMPPEPQANLSDSRSGEEGETCLFEAKSKALRLWNAEDVKGTKHEPNSWSTAGVGTVRLLQNQETGKCRVVFRAEPNGNIILNFNLVSGLKYVGMDQGKSGAVKFPLYNDKTKRLDQWVFKVRTKAMAAELEGLMKANQEN